MNHENRIISSLYWICNKQLKLDSSFLLGALISCCSHVSFDTLVCESPTMCVIEIENGCLLLEKFRLFINPSSTNLGHF